MPTYDGYNYDKFRELALDSTLSVYQKIGFPDSYRADKGNLIVEDICAKLPSLRGKRELNVLDIGPGCSDVQSKIQDICYQQGHKLFLADSPEMLALLGDLPSFVTSIPGFFPDTSEEILKNSGGIDIICCYSVFHCIYAEANAWAFIDAIMTLMRNGGEALIGDIPNNSKRRRFFSSPNGIRFHQKFMKTDTLPEINDTSFENGKINDAVLISVVLYCHSLGFDAYVVPQHSQLPFANRRDDIIIRKP